MSSVGVVLLRNTKPILQENVSNITNINNNENDKKKKEFIIVRKKSKAQLPATVSVTSLVQAVEGSLPKKPKFDDGKDETGRTPAPLAVARRNARERNRVRQVNNGFAALRKHIPDEVAEVFESVNSNRGSHKKLSKVETLRMAVEYIRSLECLLNIGESSNKENGRPSLDSFPSPASSSPRDTSYDPNYFSMNSPALDEDDFDEDDFENSLNNIGAQNFARNTGSDSFQMLPTPHLYEEDEGGNPMTPSSDLLIRDDMASPHVLEGNFQFGTSAEQFTIINPEANYIDAEPGMPENTQIDIKYAESLRLAGLQATFHNTSEFLDLNTINPQLVLPSDQFRLNGNDDHKSLDSTNNFEGIQLKQELPEISVTPEDRQQFEETLKWWEEKTRQGRFLKIVNKK